MILFLVSILLNAYGFAFGIDDIYSLEDPKWGLCIIFNNIGLLLCLLRLCRERVFDDPF